MGDQEIPVLIVDLNEDETKQLLLTLDPLAAMATVDDDLFRGLLESVEFQDAAVRDMLNALTPPAPIIAKEDPGPQIDRAEELREKYGYMEITPEIRAGFLGKNIARLAKIDDKKRI